MFTFARKIAVNKSALFFYFEPFDSTRNKSIISYDISESEASKSSTIDSLLPKKNIPKFQLSSPIGPEPIIDFRPSTDSKKTDKRKEKLRETKVKTKEDLGSTAGTKPIEKISSPISQAIFVDSIAKDTAKRQAPVVKIHAAVKPSRKVSKNYVDGLFTESPLVRHMVTPKVRNRQNGDWSTSVLLLVVGIACIINVSYRSRLKQLFNAFVSNRFVGQIVREENVMFQRISIFLSIAFLLVSSLFIFQAGSYFQLSFASNSSLANYSVILISLFVFYLLKLSAINFLGFLLKVEKEMKEYVFTLFLYNHFIGVGLIPVVVLITFVPGFASKNVFLIAAGLVLITFLLRTIRSYGNVSGASRFSIFYLFLYLCALEILPLVIIAKLIINIV